MSLKQARKKARKRRRWRRRLNLKGTSQRWIREAVAAHVREMVRDGVQPKTPHNWSLPVPVYETLAAYVCFECGVCVLADYDSPDAACAEQRVPVPLDCNFAKMYKERHRWDPELAWEDDDEPVWEPIDDQRNRPVRRR